MARGARMGGRHEISNYSHANCLAGSLGHGLMGRRKRRHKRTTLRNRSQVPSLRKMPSGLRVARSPTQRPCLRAGRKLAAQSPNKTARDSSVGLPAPTGRRLAKRAMSGSKPFLVTRFASFRNFAIRPSRRTTPPHAGWRNSLGAGLFFDDQ